MVDLDNDREDVSNCLKHLSQSPENPWVFNSNVRSDDLFKIEMAHGDATKMKQMIDFQWAMVCILALSGAAGSPELLGEPDPDEIHLMLMNQRIMGPGLTIFDEESSEQEHSGLLGLLRTTHHQSRRHRSRRQRGHRRRNRQRKVEDRRPSLLSSFEIFRVSSINVCWFL